MPSTRNTRPVMTPMQMTQATANFRKIFIVNSPASTGRIYIIYPKIQWYLPEGGVEGTLFVMVSADGPIETDISLQYGLTSTILDKNYRWKIQCYLPIVN